MAAKALGRPAAAKTGTTNDYSNAWFIGYTPRLATGVWVGYDRPRSLGRDETGSRVAVPIWTAFMSEALAGTAAEDFAVPESVVIVPVDLDPGRRLRAPGDDGLRRGDRARSRRAGPRDTRRAPPPSCRHGPTPSIPPRPPAPAHPGCCRHGPTPSIPPRPPALARPGCCRHGPTPSIPPHPPALARPGSWRRPSRQPIRLPRAPEPERDC